MEIKKFILVGLVGGFLFIAITLMSSSFEESILYAENKLIEPAEVIQFTPDTNIVSVAYILPMEYFLDDFWTKWCDGCSDTQKIVLVYHKTKGTKTDRTN